MEEKGVCRIVGGVDMKWEEMKNIVEQCVPENLLKEYTISIEISNASAGTNETRIEIDNSKSEIFVTEN